MERNWAGATHALLFFFFFHAAALFSHITSFYLTFQKFSHFAARLNLHCASQPAERNTLLNSCQVVSENLSPLPLWSPSSTFSHLLLSLRIGFFHCLLSLVSPYLVAGFCSHRSKLTSCNVAGFIMDEGRPRPCEASFS